VKAGELRQLSHEELVAELATQRQALFQLRVRRVTGEAAVASEFQRLRRDIARILTVLREREGERVAEAVEEGGDQDHG